MVIRINQSIIIHWICIIEHVVTYWTKNHNKIRQWVIYYENIVYVFMTYACDNNASYIII